MRRVPSILSVAGGFLGLLAGAALAASPEAERYEADPASSRVAIEGSSTLHAWEVEGRRIEGSLSIDAEELAALWKRSPSSHALESTARVDIPVASLASGKRGMDETMGKALKVTTHPMISYRLKSAAIPARQAAQTDATEVVIDTTGVLTVAGVERAVDMPIRVRQLSENRLEVSGETSLRMTEFGIDPPTAMLGALHTGDEIHVRWTWVLVRTPNRSP